MTTTGEDEVTNEDGTSVAGLGGAEDDDDDQDADATDTLLFCAKWCRCASAALEDAEAAEEELESSVRTEDLRISNRAGVR